MRTHVVTEAARIYERVGTEIGELSRLHKYVELCAADPDEDAMASPFKIAARHISTAILALDNASCAIADGQARAARVRAEA